MQIHVAVGLCSLEESVQAVRTNALLEALPRAKYASGRARPFDSEGRREAPSTCFEGTRVELLDQVDEWIAAQGPATPPVFCTTGIAGVGKTTIALTVAEQARSQKILGATFFFSRNGEAELRDPSRVFPSIAYQLAQFDPEFSRSITDAVEKDPEAAYASLKEQLQTLIVKPLSASRISRNRVVLVVLDALDECETTGAKEILRHLLASAPRFPFHLKILITTRPEAHIRSVLDTPANLQITVLHDIDLSIVQHDIRLFLNTKLAALPDELGLCLEKPWVDESEVDALAMKAGKLFVWAAVALRFVADEHVLDPRRQLDVLLGLHTSGGSPYDELDELYLQPLRSLLSSKDSPHVLARFHAVVGGLLVLRDPLPIQALENLTQLPKGAITAALHHLHSVIFCPSDPNEAPRFHHPSFPDFITNSTRCSDDRFLIKIPEQEERVALKCLQLLNTCLKGRMLGDLDPGLLNSEVDDLQSVLERVYRLELRYACRHWHAHLLSTRKGSPEVIEALQVFVSRCLIWWLAAMSWLGETRLALVILLEAKSWAVSTSTLSIVIIMLTSIIQSDGPSSAKLFPLLNDAHRLLLGHFDTIQNSAQQLYRSVLPFLPSSSPISRVYGHLTDGHVRVMRGVDAEWSACLNVIRLEIDSARSTGTIAYSPDGARIACLSQRSLDLLDVISGDQLFSIYLNPENDCAISAAFAFVKDGSRIATIGFPSKVIRIWDAETGGLVGKLDGHTEKILNLVSSIDGKYLASSSADMTVMVWDIDQPASLAVLVGHDDVPTSIAFSPDAKGIASAGHDGKVLLWDVPGSRCVHVIANPELQEAVRISFSPGGQHVACSFRAGLVKVWDAQTAVAIGATGKAPRLEPHGIPLEGPVPHFIFAHDGSRLFTTSHAVIQAWSLPSWELVATYKGHSDFITSITMSFDGLCLASSARDGTIGLWDPTTSDSISVLQGHLGVVQSVAFAQDGTTLASSSLDGTLRIWQRPKTATVARKTPLSADIRLTIYSPCGHRVAVVSQDRTVRVWDLAKDERTLLDAPFFPCRNSRPSFSPNQRFIVVPSMVQDSRFGMLMHLELRICNVEDGSLAVAIPARRQGSWGRPGLAAWSSCGKLLVHATYDKLQVFRSSNASRVQARNLRPAEARSMEPSYVIFLNNKRTSLIAVAVSDYGFSSAHIDIYNGNDLTQVWTIPTIAERIWVGRGIHPRAAEVYFGTPDRVQISYDGRTLARFSGQLSDKIEVYDLQTNSLRLQLTPGKIFGFLFSKNNTTIITFGVDGAVAWDISSDGQSWGDIVPEDFSGFSYYALRGREIVRFSEPDGTVAHRLCTVPSSIMLTGSASLAFYRGLPAIGHAHRIGLTTDDGQRILLEFTM